MGSTQRIGHCPQQVLFTDIEPVWRRELWPQRKSPIEPTSAIDVDLSINLEIMKRPPTFWLVKSSEERVLGVVGGHLMSQGHYRMRGIWVSEAHRGQGLGRALVDAVAEQAQSEGAKWLWTMPKESAWPFYSRIGFQNLGTTNKFEMGPHYIARREIWLRRRDSNSRPIG